MDPVWRLLHLWGAPARQDRPAPPGGEGLQKRRPCGQVDRPQSQRDRPGARPLARGAARPSRFARGGARDHEIDPESTRQVESLLRQIREWLDGRDTRRLLLLLDKADHFLLVDSENDFRESARLKGLMDETNRRFKVVFAGLHNVLRTTRHANHPLAHLGEPICVGAMTSNGEWKEAQALVREPLQAVGCRFGRDDLSTRILAHTNYYPSLIQLYGAELTRRLRDSDQGLFPTPSTTTPSMTLTALANSATRYASDFGSRCNWTSATRSSAYVLAHELKEGAESRPGSDARPDSRGRYTFWWSDGFTLRNRAIRQAAAGDGGTRSSAGDRARLGIRSGTRTSCCCSGTGRTSRRR